MDLVCIGIILSVLALIVSILVPWLFYRGGRRRDLVEHSALLHKLSFPDRKVDITPNQVKEEIKGADGGIGSDAAFVEKFEERGNI